MELLLAAAFGEVMPASGGPDVPLFKRFKTHWAVIDKEMFQDGLGDEDVLSTLDDVKDELLAFLKDYLDQKQL